MTTPISPQITGNAYHESPLPLRIIRDATRRATKSKKTDNTVSAVPDGMMPEIFRALARLTRIARLTQPVSRLIGASTIYRSF